MTQPPSSHLPPVVGEVVEVYQKAGVPTAKIAVRICHIEVPMAVLDDPHLGDRILIEADVSVRSLKPLYSNEIHPEPELDDR